MNSNSPTHTAMYYGTDKITSSSNTATMINNETNYWEIQIDDGKWTRDQTQILITTWKQYKHVLLNSTSSSSENFKIWKLIATEVNKYSPPKSLQQCKKKFRNIRYICKTAIQNNQQNSSKKHYPLFYNDFVEILAEGERLKNCIKDEAPNVEVIQDRHNDDTSLEYPDNNDMANRISPLQHASPIHQHYGGDKMLNNNHTDSHGYPSESNDEHNKFSTIKKMSSSVDSSYDSPVSHEDSTRNRDASPSSPVATTEGNHETTSGEKKIVDCNNNFQNLEETSQRHHSMSRKHRNIDVSIMGPGYPLPKRYRRMVDEPLSPVLNYRSPGNIDFPPSMTPAYEFPKTSPPLGMPPHHHHHHPMYKDNRDMSRDMSKYITSTSTTINYPRKQPDNLYKPQNLPKADSPAQVVTTSTAKAESSSENNSIHERYVTLQEKQMELFNEMLNRHEQFLLRLLQQQKEAAEEAQRRDRDFMLKLVEMFMKHN